MKHIILLPLSISLVLHTSAQSVCGSLSPPANGNVNVTGITEGSVANYSCSPGLKHVGPVIRFCLINGNWSGEDPVCEGTY